MVKSFREGFTLNKSMTHLENAGENNLMRLIAQGDKQAFNVLMRRHLPAVLNFCRQYLPEEAEDITQEAFLRLWNKAPQWQDQGISPKAWLMRVSYNLCIDELRRCKTDALDGQEQSRPDPCCSSERQLSAQADLRQQQLALQNLPENQRSAITLCAYSGLSNKEAAAVLNVSVDALESLLARGRRKLKQAFSLATGYQAGEIIDDDI